MHIVLFYIPLIILWLKTIINIIGLIQLKLSDFHHRYIYNKVKTSEKPKKNNSRLFIITPALNEQDHKDMGIYTSMREPRTTIAIQGESVNFLLTKFRVDG